MRYFSGSEYISSNERVILNNKLESVHKESGRGLSRYFPWGTEENPSQDILCPVRDLNPALSEYTAILKIY